MDYTQAGVLRVQARVRERINRALVADPRLRLDHVGWFDGRGELPRPGERWKLTLSRGGEQASVELTPAELDAFMGGDPREVVWQKVRAALGDVQPKR